MLNDWPTDRDCQTPEFFEDAQAVTIEEAASWRSVEDIAEDFAEQEDNNSFLPSVEETSERQEERTEAERQFQRAQQRYDSLEDQLSSVALDGDLFAVSPNMSREVKSFCNVAKTYIALRNKSMMKVSRYDGIQRGSRRVTLPSASDFCCDVELAARRTLTPELLKIFTSSITENDGETWNKVNVRIRDRISSLLGAAFIQREMSPVGRYFHG